jgi:hypothetical protein
MSNVLRFGAGPSDTIKLLRKPGNAWRSGAQSLSATGFRIRRRNTWKRSERFSDRLPAVSFSACGGATSCNRLSCTCFCFPAKPPSPEVSRPVATGQSFRPVTVRVTESSNPANPVFAANVVFQTIVIRSVAVPPASLDRGNHHQQEATFGDSFVVEILGRLRHRRAGKLATLNCRIVRAIDHSGHSIGRR